MLLLMDCPIIYTTALTLNRYMPDMLSVFKPGLFKQMLPQFSPLVFALMFKGIHIFIDLLHLFFTGISSQKLTLFPRGPLTHMKVSVIVS